MEIWKPVPQHRDALEAFVGPCPDGMEGCHNNGMPADNRLVNLRWDTRAGNHADKALHGTSLQGTANHLSKLTPPDVERIRDLSRAGMLGKDVAALFGVTPANISSILRRKTWAHI